MKNILVAAALLGFYARAWAQTDEVNPPSDSVSQPSPTATIEPALKGPMPEQQGLPVNPKQMPAESKIERLDREIAAVQKKLKSKRLSPAKRQELERRLGELNVQRLSIPDSVPK